jgi:phage gp36-like protein
MPFCEYADIVPSMISEQQMIELTDDQQLNVVDMTVFTDARDDVDALIEGYTRGKYPDGFTTTPKIIFKLAKEMTLYEIQKRRPHIITKEMREDADKRVLLLKDIQKGSVNLGVEQTVEEVAASGSYKTNKTAEDRMFPKAELDKY